MRMFHGTVDLFLPSINKYGLRPMAHNAWRVAWADCGDELRDCEKVDAVYLTASERHAIEYAETRVRYFAAKPGDKFPMFDCPDFFLVKDKDTEVEKVKPVLLVIEIEDGDRHLEDDPHDCGAKRFVGCIPPAKIVEIRPLSTRIKEDPKLYDEGVASDDGFMTGMLDLNRLFQELR